ncbi:helix-turn-helix domain-containing protein [Actinoplanes sp. NPDC049265]|uniref:helix-turn-helix domain-containing protein n=1 Tax=Actinoplanes sp. NPDC049265 TaxID=3363902 RepID=UPI003714C373
MTIVTPSAARTANDRAFLLLDALAALGPGPHRLRDVATQAGLEPSTAHRILQSAIRVGTVSKADRGRYSLVDRTGESSTGAVEPAPSSRLSQTGTGSMLALSRRTRLLLAALQKTTGQTVLLYVPLMLDTPMRYCLAYFAPKHDELLGDAERQLTSDILFCAPLSVDAPGRVMLAGLVESRVVADPAIAAIRAHGYAFGPSPVAGWQSVTVPLRRYGHLAGAVCITAPTRWMDAHRDETLRELLRISAELAEKIDPN